MSLEGSHVFGFYVKTIQIGIYTHFLKKVWQIWTGFLQSYNRPLFLSRATIHSRKWRGRNRPVHLKASAQGSSVAQSSEEAPFTSEIVGSSLASRYRLMCGLMHVKSVSQRSAESRGFSPGSPVSSHRESWQGVSGVRKVISKLL